jgi:hypothetical protein
MPSALGYEHPNPQLEDESDSAWIRFWWGQVVRGKMGTNAVRARIKDLIDERDAPGLSLEARKKNVSRIVSACKEIVGAEVQPGIDARREEWRRRGNYNKVVRNDGRPDSTGRVTVETIFPDGARETWLGSEEEYAALVQNELAAELANEEAKRQLRVSALPDEIRPLANDPNAVLKLINERDPSDSPIRHQERVQPILRLLRPVMKPGDWDRITAAAREGQEELEGGGNDNGQSQ